MKNKLKITTCFLIVSLFFMAAAIPKAYGLQNSGGDGSGGTDPRAVEFLNYGKSIAKWLIDNPHFNSNIGVTQLLNNIDTIFITLNYKHPQNVKLKFYPSDEVNCFNISKKACLSSDGAISVAALHWDKSTTLAQEKCTIAGVDLLRPQRIEKIYEKVSSICKSLYANAVSVVGNGRASIQYVFEDPRDGSQPGANGAVPKRVVSTGRCVSQVTTNYAEGSLHMGDLAADEAARRARLINALALPLMQNTSRHQNVLEQNSLQMYACAHNQAKQACNEVGLNEFEILSRNIMPVNYQTKLEGIDTSQLTGQGYLHEVKILCK